MMISGEEIEPDEKKLLPWLNMLLLWILAYRQLPLAVGNTSTKTICKSSCSFGCEAHGIAPVSEIAVSAKRF